jgi:hypothetical protein
VLHVQRRGLADDTHDRRLRIEQGLHLRVVFHAGVAPASHAKSGEARMFPLALSRLGEELRVLRIAARPTTFDVVDPELIELFRDPNLIEHRERNPRPLRSIAKGRVV